MKGRNSMADIDFSAIEGFASKMGLSGDMLQQVKDGLNAKVQSGEIDEKKAKKLEKECTKSMDKLDKLSEKMKAKGMEMPDLSQLASMIDMDKLKNVDLSGLGDLDFKNMSSDQLDKLKDVAMSVMKKKTEE